MPAALALVAPVVPIQPVQPEPVRLARTGGECPVCAERRCPTPDACSAEFGVRSWVACFDCDGTGWDSTGSAIWCPTCGGSKVLEG